MMNKAIGVLIAAALLSTAAAAFAQESALVREITGKVEVQAEGQPWRPVKTGERLPLGATISTSFRSEAVLGLGSSTMVVKQLTRMRLEEFARKDGVQETRLHLRVGKVRAEIQAEEGLRHDFQIRSPVSTAAVRGTGFDFDGVNLRVRSGAVALANAHNRTVRVAAGERSATDGFSAPPSGAEAMEKALAVPVGTSQLDEAAAGFRRVPDLTPGSVTLRWIYGSP